MYKSLRILMVLFLALTFQQARASTTFTGVYEQNSNLAKNFCNNVNGLSGTCACSGGEPARFNLRVLNDTGTAPNVFAGANMAICAANGGGSSNLAGVFQLDDPAAGGVGCRVPNPDTGSCTCPTGTTLVTTRAVSDNPQNIIGTKIGFCVRQSGTAGDFGGVYQQDDGVPNALGCRAPNPVANSGPGGCGCPNGFKASPLRVLADNGAYIFGSSVVACVKATTADITICPGVTADPTGTRSASAAIAQCVANTPVGGTLELPVGNYRMTSQLKLTRAITLRTQGLANSSLACGDGVACATLFADPSLNVKGGILQAADATDPVNRSVANIVVDHIMINGNRSQRLSSAAYSYCKNTAADPTEFNRPCFNMRFLNCVTCSFTNSASVNALGGTGMEWRGDNAVIRNNRFLNNGDNANMVSDGLTVGQSSNAIIESNYFTDNSDVSFIYGGGQNSVVRYNYVTQKKMRAFAGMMMDNFGPVYDLSKPDHYDHSRSNTSGDFRGTVVGPNSITCDNCYAAANIGPRFWYDAPNLIGGSFNGNQISGGQIGINVDGAGTSSFPVTIAGNTIVDQRPSSPSCPNLVALSSSFNVSNKSVTSAASSPATTRNPTDQLVFTCVNQGK